MNFGGSAGGGVAKHVPLAGTCVQVVMTPEPTSRGVEASRCLLGKDELEPVLAYAAAAGVAEDPRWAA